MNKNKPMTLLLIEDDVAECIKFKDCANRRTDHVFVGMTGSSAEGLQYVRTRMPECVILDLELHRGKGSGLQFLAELKEAKPRPRPLIVVTTHSPSNIVYNHVRDLGADFIFYKKQMDYGPDLVVNTVLSLRSSAYTQQFDDVPEDLRTLESPEERRIRITERIDTELDLIGISTRYKGHAYIHSAIFLLITRDITDSESVINRVAINCKVSYSSVIRAMQTAISRAWDSSCIEDLQTYYTARVNVHTGLPTPTEFVYYYANKIRLTI